MSVFDSSKGDTQRDINPVIESSVQVACSAQYDKVNFAAGYNSIRHMWSGMDCSRL